MHYFHFHFPHACIFFLSIIVSISVAVVIDKREKRERARERDRERERESERETGSSQLKQTKTDSLPSLLSIGFWKGHYQGNGTKPGCSVSGCWKTSRVFNLLSLLFPNHPPRRWPSNWLITTFTRHSLQHMRVLRLDSSDMAEQRLFDRAPRKPRLLCW